MDATVGKAFLALRYNTSVHYRRLMKNHYPAPVTASPHIWWARDSLRNGESPTPWPSPNASLTVSEPAKGRAMTLMRFIILASRHIFILAILAGVGSGLSMVGLLASVNHAIHHPEQVTPPAVCVVDWGWSSRSTRRCC